MSVNPIYSYESTLADSLKIRWTVEDLIGGDKKLDFTRPFLPDSLARTQDLTTLSARERLVLNQIRGASYLHLFGLVEEFILPFAIDRAGDDQRSNKTRTRALLKFAEEEAKHQQLFQRFSSEFAKGFASPIEFIGPAEAIADTVLSHTTLAVAILILHLEWTTQRHYLDSVKTDEALDPLFVSLLKHHWQEEAQHAKLDTIVVTELASRASQQEIEQSIDDFLKIGGILEAGLQQQAKFDLDALERKTGRKLSEAERAQIYEVQLQSYRYTFLVSGLEQKNFAQSIYDLSRDGAIRVKGAAAALAA